ncbi:Cytidylyltransferase family protein [Caprobacter fermentans]|uniref:Phosphatidate cytidylyltransferase n=1 Tax=Caproicibacter fermentans TaxID=2576756 RepID=A0A6N8I1D4_9FIRM|nr:phosphatidate cytidylyltransferase [Caproicibacter fermentans]MVB11914.1 Cytidylyltransferase family protein [Caproicibacter fermentans]OCM99851.1 phosphatidate cytidylyltransferase [Clostridium sp. W14A]QNK41148.1 phosphatidate cytidylyltransferase [Caproicibacter fermentans]
MRTRVTSALTLIVFLAAIVICNSTLPLALNFAIGLISVLAVNEIITALGLAKNLILLIPSLLFSAVFPFLGTSFWHDAAYFLYTVIIFSALILYHTEITFREVGVIYSMSLLIPSALGTIISLREIGGSHGMFYVIIGIFSAWTADVGAFFAGTFFGKHKLCPNISPHKTVEGAVGGLLLNVAAMLVFGYLFHAIYYAYSVNVSYLPLVLIGVFGTGISILGDLSFSLIKRSCHIKDFSEIIPGHGGILDRFDSVIFEAPFVYILVQLLPIVLN